MDDRVEAFLRDVLALEGQNSIDVRRGVRHRLAGCEKLFRDAEPDEKMKGRRRLIVAGLFAALAYSKRYPAISERERLST